MYLSEKPGLLGGNKEIKIYGKLDCPSALRWIAKRKYVKNRVCMKEKYKQWKEKNNSQDK